MKSEFRNGCEFIREEIEKYILSNKETIYEYEHSAQHTPKEREMFDVENFLTWLGNQLSWHLI